MEKAEDLQPIVHGKHRLQYFVAFDVQAVQDESHEEDYNLHNDDAELHQQPRRVQHGVFLRKRV